ncbi:predicted protein [Histoplasma capsulatum var. duboisii H88]|uniref:Predicted protein n=1 Tax=Ajellomyces capsulatus (strain H88) TaxID=544711 RepID=F0UDH7_AJEC8|nr:predicted protein [Histoplasma capsulatum var. duboisii H88]QSS48913.1 hypothetical protein I7I53_09122 [Histoplasma capsulatum var. duboisii H88]
MQGESHTNYQRHGQYVHSIRHLQSDAGSENAQFPAGPVSNPVQPVWLEIVGNDKASSGALFTLLLSRDINVSASTVPYTRCTAGETKRLHSRAVEWVYLETMKKQDLQLYLINSA